MVSLPEKNNKQKDLAPESPKTKKAREKLKRQFEMSDAKMTKEALERKAGEIQRRIAKYAGQRVVLKAKSISLFDENQNTAAVSQKVMKIVEKLQGE